MVMDVLEGAFRGLIGMVGTILTMAVLIIGIVIVAVVVITLLRKYVFTITIPDSLRDELERLKISGMLNCPLTIKGKKLLLVGRDRSGQVPLGMISGWVEEETRIKDPKTKTNQIVKQDVFILTIPKNPLAFLPIIGFLFRQQIYLKLLQDEHSDLVGDISVYSSGIRAEEGFFYTVERVNRGIRTIMDDLQQRLTKADVQREKKYQALIAGATAETNLAPYREGLRREGMIKREKASKLREEEVKD